MSGQVAMVCAPLGDLVAQAKAGTITLLAASGKTRDPQVTEIPTFIEQGFNLWGSGWYAIFAPAKTPDARVAGSTRSRQGDPWRRLQGARTLPVARPHGHHCGRAPGD